MANRDEGPKPRSRGKNAEKPRAVKRMSRGESVATEAAIDGGPAEQGLRVEPRRSAAAQAPEAISEKQPRAKDHQREEEVARLKEKFRSGPRRPVQILEAGKSFWVFCDDGTVCVARPKKGGTLKWSEAEPPMPGSVADMHAQLGKVQARARERAARAASEAT